jgi:hypothetical protein
MSLQRDFMKPAVASIKFGNYIQQICMNIKFFIFYVNLPYRISQNPSATLWHEIDALKEQIKYANYVHNSFTLCEEHYLL